MILVILTGFKRKSAQKKFESGGLCWPGKAPTSYFRRLPCHTCQNKVNRRVNLRAKNHVFKNFAQKRENMLVQDQDHTWETF